MSSALSALIDSYSSRGEVSSWASSLTFGGPITSSCDYTETSLYLSVTQTTGGQYGDNYISLSGFIGHYAPCPEEYGAPPGACCPISSSRSIDAYSYGIQASYLAVGKTNDASLDFTINESYSSNKRIIIAADFNCRQPIGAGKTSSTYTSRYCYYGSPCTATKFSSNGFTCFAGDLSGTITLSDGTVFDLSTGSVTYVAVSRSATATRSITTPLLPK
jgi:hypothetical protein